MMNFEGIQDLGGASAQNETQAPEEKVVNLEEQKKKRQDRKSTRLNSSHYQQSRMPSSA